MGTAAKATASILFVAALAATLAAPIIRARDGSTDDVVEEVDLTIDVSGSSPTLGVYPRRCLEPVAPPPGLGLIATAYNRMVEIGTPDVILERFRGSRPISWSPSGIYLAWGPGQIHEVAPLRSIGGSRRLSQWTWSPIADCLIGRAPNGALYVRDAVRGSTRLLFRAAQRYGEPRSISGFEFSRDGLYLRITINGKRSVLSLREQVFVTGRARSVGFDLAPRCPDLRRFHSTSCAPNGRFVVGVSGDHAFLFERDGSNATRLTDGDYLEAFPEWGTPGTGVLLPRFGPDGDAALWFVAEGDAARRTPFALAQEPFAFETFPWWSIVDWSVTPPYVRCGSSFCFPT